MLFSGAARYIPLSPVGDIAQYMIFNKIVAAMIQYDKPARANFASHPLVQRTKKLDADSQQSKQQSRKATNASGRVLPQPSLNQSSLNQLSTLSSSTQFENQPLQNNTDSNPEVSASRVIWNALAIASMVTLIGFGLLSLKLSNDLNQAQANLNAIQSLCSTQC